MSEWYATFTFRIHAEDEDEAFGKSLEMDSLFTQAGLKTEGIPEIDEV